MHVDISFGWIRLWRTVKSTAVRYVNLTGICIVLMYLLQLTIYHSRLDSLKTYSSVTLKFEKALLQTFQTSLRLEPSNGSFRKMNILNPESSYTTYCLPSKTVNFRIILFIFKAAYKYISWRHSTFSLKWWTHNQWGILILWNLSVCLHSWPLHMMKSIMFLALHFCLAHH